MVNEVNSSVLAVGWGDTATRRARRKDGDTMGTKQSVTDLESVKRSGGKPRNLHAQNELLTSRGQVVVVAVVVQRANHFDGRHCRAKGLRCFSSVLLNAASYSQCSTFFFLQEY